MSNRAYVLIAAVAIVALLLWNSIFIVNEKEQAVVLRFGEIQRVIDEPGLNLKLPFSFAGADTVRKLPDRLLRFDLDNIRVQVSGGKFYEVDAFLVYHIADAARFAQTVSGSIEQAEQRLRTRLDAALRRVYGLRGFEAALSEERADMMRQVRDQIRPDATSLGLELTDVRIRRTDLTQEVSQQTYERMQAERLAEAERLRARGQVAARRIRAAADRAVVETVASARREAEILQGEGDAERNRIFAEAFGRNPEFFDFYRSMQAYREAMSNSGTTLVLSPESEFFRYFRADGGSEAAVGMSGANLSGAQPSMASPSSTATPDTAAPAEDSTAQDGDATSAPSPEAVPGLLSDDTAQAPAEAAPTTGSASAAEPGGANEAGQPAPAIQ
ncbi:SPFH domain-containing protein [Aurantimonas marianensis]|uniref:protease modulator HflC n=1 Tax=Aurantimonas marianensis TaxID=2920428 RepID=UPI003C2E96AC